MFGYVKVFRPDLKIGEYEQYKAVYCSLCRTLGERYGLAARMTLSYDFTFLALFLMALEDREIVFEQDRCPFHPLKKRSFCVSNDILDYTADVAMLLVYYKLSDTVKDERFIKRLKARALKCLYKRDYQRAVSRRAREAEAAMDYMRAQEAVESSDSPCVDACAEPTAAFLSTIATSRCTDDQAACIARFGYCLGRFIYLADATEDLADDVKNNRFNPYAVGAVARSDSEWLAERKSYAAQSLHASVAVCAECFSQLKLYRFQGILSNVIFKGLPLVIQRLSKNEEGATHEKSV